ncbi:MAG: hypothetical protein HOP10_15150 [Chitinophagaceae bacterium]|nr:hypothetical protein [Chitinophagaceae bacterium]
MRSLIVSFLLIVTVKASGQINIICPQLTDSTLNYFYIGVDNPIEVRGVRISANHRVIVNGGGTLISLIGNNQCIVRATSATDSCFIKILNGKKEIFSKQFKVITIPDPDVRLAGVDDSIISKTHILANPFLNAGRKNFYLKDYYQVISFNMTFDTENDSIITTSAKGNQLTEEQIGLIKNMKSGMMVTVENIRARAWDGRTRKLVPFWFKIE